MRQFYSKLLLFLFIPIFSFSTYSCSDEKENDIETEITVKDLPASAKEFLNKYFYDYSVTKVNEDFENGIILYEVSLEGGYEIVFNSDGEWTQVEAPYGKTIPTGFIPEPVMATLNQQYQGYGINEINTTGEGYKVELSDNQGGSGIDIWFNMSGEITNVEELD